MLIMVAANSMDPWDTMLLGVSLESKLFANVTQLYKQLEIIRYGTGSVVILIKFRTVCHNYSALQNFLNNLQNW